MSNTVKQIGDTPTDRALDDAQGHLERWQASPRGQVYRLVYEIENLLDDLDEASTDGAKIDALDLDGERLLLAHQKFGRALLRISKHRELMKVARGR